VAPASRLVTLMPLFRVLIAITILVLTALVALSELGVNTAPLIAGASILGLAISFGSQALVRDIMSGIFFIADDAFRIGEYIDTGKLKGTVEAISVRSVKLRHQNGQVHTIPFGQLLSVTNFSRDWSTVKFNLRLVRDVDVEHVRKTVKKIGQEMLEDPELARELIQPLKLQGVADVLDNAIVVRLKFTARPVKPNWVQREALKRIVRAFADGGIAFASNAVTVQTTADADPASAAAAATVLPPKEIRAG
jgi:small-conductance mechanosensitive channel